MVDFGYDISDYCAIDPLFGTMDDFDAVLAEAHRLGLKVILDLVPNHTSSEHPWFLSSRASRTSEFRDWYIWRDPAPDGGPPNNWLSAFGGSGWEFDPTTRQYYYHTFLSCQPDLNWRNPKVREAIKDVMRFWFDKGVDGFRMDALWYLLKDERFRDNPPNPDYREGEPPDHQLLPLYTTDLPEIHEAIADLRRVADAYGDQLVDRRDLPSSRKVGRLLRQGPRRRAPAVQFLAACRRAGTRARLQPSSTSMKARCPPGSWPNWVLGNHDRPRIASRVGAEQARVAAMLLLTLRGTPTLYNGDELGMPMAHIPADRVLDPFEVNVPGLGLGRDGARSPMPWSDSAYAGFSRSEPWCPLIEDWKTTNVALLENDPASILALHRKLLRLRKQYPALMTGSYHPLLATGDILLYRRKQGPTSILVALNLGSRPETVVVDNFAGTALLSTSCDRADEYCRGQIDLRPNEGLVILESDAANH